MQNHTWAAAYASVQGHGHRLHGLACQDACAHGQAWGPWSLAIVCDGAGSAQQSDKGADFVSRNLLHTLGQALEQQQWTELPSPNAWRQVALQALRQVAQGLQNYAQVQGYRWAELACTVLAVAYAPFGLLCLHLGDGRGAYRTGGQWQAMFKPFKGEEANETVFITSAIWQAEALERYVGSSVIQAPIEALALLSDGCEKAAFEVNLYDETLERFYDPNRPYPKFFEPNIEGLQQLAAEGKSQTEINALWAAFLDNGLKAFQQEQDDKTLMLVVKLAK
jgi:hypothetical protein